MAEFDTQPLPRTFEEFNEQRKAAFIRVKDFKQAGNRLVGVLCSYTPMEIIDAAGASAVGLCGTSDEVIPDAEKVLPANLCPLIKSTYGFAYSQKCPFTYFSDLIIGETTCDGKKKMYELLADLKPVHILHLPQSRERAYERAGWREECRLLKERLEELYGITITDDDLRAAVRRRNRLRAAGTGSGVKISSMCTVFAESEVISLVGRGEARENIAHAVIESVASRVVTLAGQGAGAPFFLTGGLCENVYFVERLGALLGSAVTTCPEARFAGALGAAERALALAG